MPCLDAEALTNDGEGLDFLRAVLDTAPGQFVPADAFDPNAQRPSWTISAPERDSAPRQDKMVPEAA